MKHSARKRSRSCFHSFLQTSFLLAIAILPLQLIAQKKISGNAINKTSVTSLAHVFKNYTVLSIDAPGLAAYARTNPAKNLDVQFDFAGLPSMRLDLVENDILSNDYKLIVGTASGEQVLDKPLIKTYKGKLVGDNKSNVYLTVSDQSVFGVIKGFGKEYYIEPLKYFSKDAEPGVTVLYEAKDVIPHSGMGCGVTEAEQKVQQLDNNITQRASGTCKMVEVAIASDFSMLNKYLSPAVLQEHNIGVMGLMIHIFQEAQIGTQYLEFKIAGQYISASPTLDPFEPAYTGNDAVAMLSNFSNWGNRPFNNPFRSFSFDMAQLWTAKDIGKLFEDVYSYNVIGLANIGTICAPYKYQVLEDFTASGLAKASLAAHETGHIFGCQHDESDGYIMNPTVGNPPYTIFSDASLYTMNNYIGSQGSCLSSCDQSVVAQFSSSANAICVGNTVTFTEYSVGAVTSRSWNFGPGATTVASTDKTVTVSYSTTGPKEVTLYVSNGSNSATTKKNIMVGSAPASCRTEGLNSTDYGILTSFKLENISMSNQILIGAGQYIDKSCTDIAGLATGTTYFARANIGVNHILDQYSQPSKLQVLLDYNDDGDFQDANENIYYSPACAEAEVVFPIGIPRFPPLFNRFLRLRVMAIPCSVEPTDGCSIPPKSQVVDFSVYLGVANTYYFDGDFDTFGDPNISIQTFSPPQGFVSSHNDCNDRNSLINPLTQWIIDNDNDGYYINTPIQSCISPGALYKMKLSQQPGDCDDNNRFLNPLTQWITDIDNDGYYPGTPVTQCISPGEAYFIKTAAKQAGDCDDDNAAINPLTEWITDNDNDGYYAGTPVIQCISPGEAYSIKTTAHQEGDCDDNNRLLNPLTQWITDHDDDGYYTGTPVTQCISPGAAYKVKLAQVPGDCNDNDPAVNAGTTEVCANRKDDNCNGSIDEISCAPCLNATGLTTTSITASSAKLNWVAVANPLIWELRYKKTGSGTQWITLPQMTGHIRSVTISSLTANATYNWQIRAKCGNAWTKYTEVATFVTLSLSDLDEITTRKATESNKIDAIAAPALTVRVMPNPSHGSFTIAVTSNNKKDRVSLQVADVSGRIIENRTINAGQLIQLGGKYNEGFYFVRVIQGKQAEQIKLIKLKE